MSFPLCLYIYWEKRWKGLILAPFCSSSSESWTWSALKGEGNPSCWKKD